MTQREPDIEEIEVGLTILAGLIARSGMEQFIPLFDRLSEARARLQAQVSRRDLLAAYASPPGATAMRRTH